jgi:glycosyltransferase involved in cell wall biosynthesis
MRHVTAQSPGALCLNAGAGSQQLPIQQQIQLASLERNVQLLGFRNDVPSLMAAADVFVLPSLVESFGLVIVEAMALGRPVIATSAGGPLEIVVHEETGLLVPPANPQALAQAILRLLANPAQARQMGAAGQARARQRYTAERMAKETLAVYQNAAESSG